MALDYNLVSFYCRGFLVLGQCNDNFTDDACHNSTMRGARVKSSACFNDDRNL